MRAALRQARKGLGRTSPNPAVGAVIVRAGEIIATGYHRKAGLDHAEVAALNRVGGRAAGATLYVTLEPCNHYGRTPPCTRAILRSGINRVVVGTRDPNAGVTGGGCEYLEKNGVEVKTGVLEDECRRLNETYIKFVTSGEPFLNLKSALTLDGWTATATGHSRWVTNEKSRRFVHRLRDRVDAVMVGVGTILADDPLLTTRLRRKSGKDPLRVIVDPDLRIPARARVLNHRSNADTVIAAGDHVRAADIQKIERPGVATLSCTVKDGRVDLRDMVRKLGARSVTSMLVEGGAGLFGAILREELGDKFYIFKAAKILGGEDGAPFARGQGPTRMDRCLRLKQVRVRRFDDDVLISGYPEEDSRRRWRRDLPQ